jgi:hypothetical protein
MKNKNLTILLGALLIFNTSKAQDKPMIDPDPTFMQFTSLNYKDYSLKIYLDENNANGHIKPTILILTKNNKEVFKLEAVNPKYLKIVTLGGDSVYDINGDKIKELIIEEYSGGTHCCTYWYILALGEEYRMIDKLNGLDGYFALEDKNIDKKYEIITQDYGFLYWNSFYWEFTPPEVILSYQNGKYLPDAKLMRKKPNATTFKQEAKLAKQKIDSVLKAQPDWSYSLGKDARNRWTFLTVSNSEFDIWLTLLNLVYSGNRAKAKKFVSKAFPKALKPHQEIFWLDFENQLLKCNFLPKVF